MSWTRNLKNLVAYLIYLGFTVAVILELIFRVLPTTTPLFLTPVTSQDDILRHEPDKTTTFSKGVDFYDVVQKSTNNYGFYSSNDYVANSEPDIMVIGDSYVEASQMLNEDSLGEVIAQLEPGLNVYQMGVSGVPISQYIKMMEYAQNEFAPSAYILVFVGNDFDESLCTVRIKEGTWCFDEDQELQFYPFLGYSTQRKLARSSAFMRYLVFHLNFNWRTLLSRIGGADAGMSAANKYAGNTTRTKPREITAQSIGVIDQFFESVDSMGLSDKVTIILDTDRSDIYANEKTDSYFREMRQATIKAALENSVRVIDMDVIFREDYQTNGEIFEYPTDGHWNERAHRLAAEAYLNQR
jgi:hypothetical protein